jgi:hypothetical protein
MTCLRPTSLLPRMAMLMLATSHLAHFGMVSGCAREHQPARPASVQVVRVNAGAHEPIVDELGRTWEADNGFWGGGGVADRGPIAVAATPTASIYRTERWGVTEFRRPMPNGRYLVRCHFAETFKEQVPVGHRLMIVDVQGVTFARVDVMQEVGWRAALVKEAHVTVNDGILLIRFGSVAGSHHVPLINAVEVLPLP